MDMSSRFRIQYGIKMRRFLCEGRRVLKCLLKWIALSGAGLLLCACAKGPDVSASMNMTAAQYLNPDIQGNAAPIMVSFYELKTPMSFKQSNYFDLSANAESVLQDTLVDKQTIEMRPGESKNYKLNFPRSVRYIGITAGYRRIDQAVWRSVIAVPVKKDSISVSVNLESEALNARLTSDGDSLL